MAVNETKPKQQSPRTNLNGTPNAGSERRVPTRANRDDTLDAPAMSVEGIRRGCLGSGASKFLLGLLLLTFAGGIFLTGVGGGFNDLGGNGGPGAGNPDETVATVGGQAIKAGQLDSAFGRQMDVYKQFGMPIETSQLLSRRADTLQNLIKDEALAQDAQAKMGAPTSAEVDAYINKKLDESLKSQQGDNPAAFRRQLEAQGKTVEGLRQETLQNVDRDAAARELAVDKLKTKVQTDNKVTEADYIQSQTKLRLRQIVLRPKPAANAKPNAKPQDPAKTEADLKARAEKLAQQLGANPSAAQFSVLAKTQSDDTFTKPKGGDLGLKLPAELPFSAEVRDAVAAAKGKLVGPVQDPNTKDYFLIFVESRQLSLPKDYAKNKATLFKAFETQRDDEAWQKYQDEIGKRAQADTVDPALVAYKAMQTQQSAASLTGDAATRVRQDAIASYETALSSAQGQYAAAINSELVTLYRQTNQPAKALEALRAATQNAPEDNALRLELARTLATSSNKKDKTDALTQLQTLSKNLDRAPAQPSPFGGGGSNPQMQRLEVASLYEQLGRKDLAGAERQKMKAAPAANSPFPLGGAGGGLPPGVQIIPQGGAPAGGVPGGARP